MEEAKPNLSNLGEFGYKNVVYLLHHRTTGGKFGPRVEEGLLLGYSTGGE